MSPSARTSLQFIRRTSGLAGLALVALIGWVFLIASESAMGSAEGGALKQLMRLMMHPGEAGPYLLAASAMWVVMMIAMMVPAALLMMVVFRRAGRGSSPDLDSFLVGLGYLASWSAFAAVAACFQWWLHAQGWLGGMTLASVSSLSAGLLIAAGLYQLTPLKDACLSRCRSPIGFFLDHWREGHAGAFAMGFRHGLYCMGCCWLLMLLMFAGGAMSVATMAALCLFILAERLLPAGPWVSRLPGVALMTWGVWIAAAL